MPEDKRNKANSYRGCAFFAYEGVKLEKMFKEALKAKEEKGKKKKKEVKEEKGEKPRHAEVPETKVPKTAALAPVPSGSIAGQEKLSVALLLTSTPPARRFAPVCGYRLAPPAVITTWRNNAAGAKKMRHLVGIATPAMPPPGC